ncbi:unnamed protein product [Candidula unifasciata]|uniref:LicD/FKTN/FKRP nucleotidyltransferase domain-containing protein n=1 Tax=Candidula unifasciata TaxID=100452 RepID=A0A8S3ZLG0_9EUPU|nr:unnamed protein product [Candidula unifasciata]
MFPMTSSLYRRICFARMRIAFLLFCILVALICCVFVIPVRNVVFSSAIEYAWKEIPTSNLLQIHYSKEIIPDGVYQIVACYEHQSPRVSKSDVNTSRILPCSHTENASLTWEILQRQHGRFLPFLNMEQKIQMLCLYSVLSEVLSDVNVEHFLVGGSLLGIMRHRGMIPWDDDLDIAVSFQHLDIIKQTLSCVQGFELTIRPHLHWKFHYSGSDYPFVDIFFYQMDESYVWSLTYYIRNTFIYPRTDVFPLRTGIFEGLRVPIPGNALAIAKRIYEYDKCTAYPNHVELRDPTLLREHPCGFVVTSLDCRELSYIYRMYHLHESP